MQTNPHVQPDATAATFSTDTTNLPECSRPVTVQLQDGDTFDLRISSVVKRIGDDDVRMLAYNGSIPGPTLRVAQGAEITVRVQNDGDVDATVHWHGLRLDNKYDGVPHETQEPIPVGGHFTYQVRFPDEGLYWYHPHVREDYGLELGLYGNLIVDSAQRDYWGPADSEFVITLDDILIEEGKVAPFLRSGPTYVAMGRFGNVMLTSGETNLELSAGTGDVVRMYLTNTANTRIFNVAVPGVQMKLVGGDSGRYEHDEFVDEVLLAPSERAIVDVMFDRAGSFVLAHNTPDRSYLLGEIAVSGDVTESPSGAQFPIMRTNPELSAERAAMTADLDRPPDKTLAFWSQMPLLYGDPDQVATAWTCPMHPEYVSAEAGTCPSCGMKLIPAEEGAAAEAQPHSHDSGDGLEWEDLMPEINAASDSCNMLWKLVDRETGKENADIDWSFRVGDRVKIRLVNEMDSDHPMHHPFHIHGAGRFLVLARGEVPEPNLVWKDTVLVRAGETTDILLDVTNKGIWMAHCHIAEHAQSGMMFSFPVHA